LTFVSPDFFALAGGGFFFFAAAGFLAARIEGSGEEEGGVMRQREVGDEESTPERHGPGARARPRARWRARTDR